MDEPRNDAGPPLHLVPYAQAAALFAVYALGYAWFASWCSARLEGGPRSQLIIDASVLVLAGLLVALSDWRVVRTRGLSQMGRGWKGGTAVAFQTLFLLGVFALVLRLFDPSFDEQELGLRSLQTPRALVGFLGVLPFGVAAEEIIFRACQRRLRLLLWPAPACVGIASCFAAYHWPPGAPLDRHLIETLVVVFAGGLALAAAYERSGSVALLVMLHLVYDYLAVAQALLNVQDEVPAEAGLFLVWLSATGAIGWRLRRRDGMANAAPGAQPGARPPLRAAGRVAGWIAALVFGCGLPLLVSWIRLRLAL